MIGPPRHLALVPDAGAERIEWPVPFADGLTILQGLRGRRVVALVSGDPFWFGAGRAISERFGPEEWRAAPQTSTFSVAASCLGWPLEDTVCLGLHAAPLARLRPHLAQGIRAFVLLRDGGAVAGLAEYLVREGFGGTTVTALEALGGPRERITSFAAHAVPMQDFAHPVAVALEIAGDGRALPVANGLDDDWFDSDGQITKRPVRALALSALAPRPGETLWDIGGGSGSIGIEWCLSHKSLRAVSIEARADRAARIRANADQFGLDRLEVVAGEAPGALADLAPPDAVFIGGGLSVPLLAELEARVAPGTRLVAHAVTLESEEVLATASGRLGGDLLRIDLSEAAPLGPKRGWKASYPVVQWRVTL